MGFLSNLTAPLLRAVYPKKCMCCGRLIPENKALCELCEHYIERFPIYERCIDCGMDVMHCRCRYSIFHFEGLIAPYYNYGLAQKAFYSYKLGGREHYADFFAEKIARDVKTEYRGLRIEAVCCVPPSKQRMKKYGYNPAEQMARAVAEKLCLQYIPDVLISNKKKSTQHLATRTERFKSIRDSYRAVRRLNFETVLLVDDIASTGATLDECARQLMIGGVQHVVCAAALISSNGDRRYSEYTLNVLRRQGIAVEKSKIKVYNNKR